MKKTLVRMTVVGALMALTVAGQPAGGVAAAASPSPQGVGVAAAASPGTGVKATAAKSGETSASEDDKRKWVEINGASSENAQLEADLKAFRDALKAKEADGEVLKKFATILVSAGQTVTKERDYVVQVVEYVKGTPEALPENRQIRTNEFFRYNKAMKKVAELSKPRIFGNTKVTAVFIVLNVPKVVGIDRKKEASTPEERDAAAGQLKVLLTELGRDFSRLDLSAFSERSEKGEISLKYPAFQTSYAGIKQYLAITKRIPANWSNVMGILSLAGYIPNSAPGVQFHRAKYEYAALYGSKDLTEVPLPCDMDFILGEPEVDTKELLVSSGKFKKIGKEFNVLNEGRYYWDASIGLPVTNVRQLEYVSEGGRIQSREISLPNLYAMGNFFLPFDKGGVDLDDATSYWKPRILFGAGIKGKPFDRLFFGMGMGLGLPGVSGKLKFLNEVQLFGGWARTNYTDKPANGAPADQLLPQRTSYRFAFGLNIPVKSAAARLKAAKK